MAQSSQSKEDILFESIYRDLWEKIYNYIYYRVQNAEEAKELTQDVFGRVYKSEQRKELDSNKLTSYTYTTAKNIVYDTWRKNGRHPQVIHLDKVSEEEINLTDQKNIDQTLILKEALQSLPKDSRRIISLRIIEGYSVEDVSKITGKPKGTIKSMQYRALKKLKEELGKGGYPYE